MPRLIAREERGQPWRIDPEHGDPLDVVDLDCGSEHVRETGEHGDLERQRTAIAEHPLELALLDIAG